MELTNTRDGRVYVRYLEGGAEPGDPRPSFLAVGTYPVKDAFGALQRVADREGAIIEEIEDGGLVVTSEESPTSVYLAFPGSNYQVEIYDPDAERAFSLATSGQVRSVG